MRHIKSIAPNRQLDYMNMLISCCDVSTCGCMKKNIFNSNLVTPTEVDSLSHFAFDVMGAIIGKDDRGEFTINTLNLNSQILVEKRKALIDSFVYLLMGGIDDEAEKYLTESEGRYNKFHSTIQYLHHNGAI